MRSAAGIGVGRLLAFSDGVFAIAFTILVLDLNVPDGLTPAELIAELRAQVPNLLSAALSFAVIGRFWISHHQTFDQVRVIDIPLLWLNVLLLALIAVVPFSTALLAEYGNLSIAVIAYSATVGGVASIQLVVFRRAARLRQLTGDPIADVEVLGATLGLGGAAFAFLIAIPVAPFSTTAAQLCWLITLVPGDPLAARWYARRR